MLSFPIVDFSLCCNPHLFHIPACRKGSLLGIAELVALGGPNVIGFPVLRTREPYVYRAPDRSWRRWHERGAAKAPDIDLFPAPVPPARKSRAPRQSSVAR